MKLIIRMVVVVTLVTVIMTCSIALAQKGDTPVEAFKRMAQAALEKDYGGIWDVLSIETRQVMGKMMFHDLAMSTAQDQILQQKMEVELPHLENAGPDAKFTREDFVKIIKMLSEIGENPIGSYPSLEVKELRREGDKKAIILASAPGEDPEEVTMVLEEGKWRCWIPDPFEEVVKEKSQ